MRAIEEIRNEAVANIEGTNYEYVLAHADGSYTRHRSMSAAHRAHRFASMIFGAEGTQYAWEYCSFRPMNNLKMDSFYQQRLELRAQRGA